MRARNVRSFLALAGFVLMTGAALRQSALSQLGLTEAGAAILAGKEAVGAARSAAEAWLKELGR